MIPAHLLTEAMNTSHALCDGPEGCIHAEGCEANYENIQKMLKDFFEHNPIAAIGDPGSMIFFLGLHTGYRLHQLEVTPTPKDKVN